MRWIWVVALVAACGSSGGSSAAGSGSGSGSSVAAAPPAGSGSSAGSAVTQAGSAPIPPATPPPLSPKIKAARCGEPCLFLVDTPLAKLPEQFAADCAGMKTPDLGYTDCKQLDYVRNCIYAAHGVVFKKKKWKVFKTKPWYEPHPEIAAKAALSPFELENVHELNSRGKACKKGHSISGADYDRAKAWFNSLPHPALPTLVLEDTSYDLSDDFEVKPPADLPKWLESYLPDAKARFARGKLATATYSDGEERLLAKLGELLKPIDTKKLRVIQVDFDSGEHGTEEAPYTGGIHVKLVYDDKDALVAITVASYGFD